MNRYICIHGHFYQPPRENAWLETIEAQDSADPYHDWNERIAAECFGPNARCRILDERDRILRVVNNYSQISFNFGPTLLSWMEEHVHQIYDSILEADRESARLHSGHGSAIAQAYNHTILPLATRRQKRIQVLWGLRDFQRRFQRLPEGMWLPETAVDIETLEVLAEAGIRFTILAPHQARSVREIGGESWIDVTAATIDTTRPYRVPLPSGAALDVFFYDGPTSRAVAFEGILKNGENFANRLLGSTSATAGRPVLIHIATDGETYGHHHRFGEMALAYALNYLESNQLAKITNYGEFLEKNPPTWEVRIHERTAWSCAHGIGRWCRDCGCQTGAHPDWQQSWRTPLRDAFDWLAEAIEPDFVERGRRFFNDPWLALEDYIDVILDRSPGNIAEFFQRHGLIKLEAGDQVTALKLLEMQRYAALMYTSCGWFFDEISGIETRQIIQYAGRVVELAEQLFEKPFEEEFLKLLEKAPSNIPEHGNGRAIYEKCVKTAAISLLKVGAHYALSSLFEEYERTTRISRYAIESRDVHRLRAGRGQIAVGRIEVLSEITRETQELTYAAFHLGDHILNGGVRAFRSEEEYQKLRDDLQRIVERVDFPGLVRFLDRHFKEATYSLDSLFRDEQRKILKIILDSTLAEMEASLSALYHRHTPLMSYLENMGVELPGVFAITAQFVLNTSLRRALREDDIDPESIQALLKEARRRMVQLDTDRLSFELQNTLGRLARLAFEDSNVQLLERVEALVDLAQSLPFQTNLWQAQDIYYRRLQLLSQELADKPPPRQPPEKPWVARFLALGDKLGIRVDPSVSEKI